MPLTLITLPCLSDNYAYLVHDDQSGATAVIDVPDAAPILAALKARDWTLSDILITHHHWDHTDGVEALRQATGARVSGNGADAARLPALDRVLHPGDSFDFGGESVAVLDVPGHTIGHIAFHFPVSKLAFTADSLMILGCGRLFEGTPDQMWDSLERLAALPPETLICSGHEYAAANARFALTIDPENAALKARATAVEQARAAGRPTVPAPLSQELETNPFLRVSDPEIRARLGLENAPDAAVFAEIRARKDRF